jgi:Putative adhesin
MGATEPMTGIPQPPPERTLPDAQRHRRELLALIAAGRPVPQVPRWAIPLGAAAAVVAIAVTAAALVPLVGHRSAAGGHSTATSTGPAQGATRPCQAPAAGQCQRTDTFTTAAPRGGLTVLGDVGAVTITGSGRDSIRVTEKLTYRGYPPVITRSYSRGVLTLSYRCRSDDCGDAFDIQVPRSLGVRVTTGTGTISLTSLTGQAHAYADVGSIHGSGLAGTLVALRTGVGSIDASFTSAPAQLSANADTGSVRLLVPPGPGYRVAASADVGSVSVSVRRDASSGHAIQASADVGSVTIASG